MTRRAAALAALALAALLAPAPAQAAARPVYGGELRVALPAPASIADPALAELPQDLALVEALHAAPLTLRPDGALEAALLAEPPVASPDGRSYRLLLRDGLRGWDGLPIGAAELADALARLLRPELRSPHAWIAVAIQGADEVLAGRARTPSGLQVLSERELLVTLAFPFPEFPAALAAAPASPRSRAGAGAGPFRPAAREGVPWPARLEANPRAWRGRPLADGLLLTSPDGRAAARALQAGEVDLSLRPEAAPGGRATGRPTVTIARLAPGRLGGAAAAVRATLAALDRADLVRRLQRAPAEPLTALLPPAILPAVTAPAAGAAPAPAAAPRPGPGGAGARVVLLLPAGNADLRAIAERLQVKLFDAGLRPVLEPASPPRLVDRLTAGDYDVALLQVTLLSTSAPLAAGQVAGALAGPLAARRAEQALSGLACSAPAGQESPALAAAAALLAELELWPLVTSAGRAAPGPALRGLALRPDGTFDAGDLWRLPGAGP